MPETILPLVFLWSISCSLPLVPEALSEDQVSGASCGGFLGLPATPQGEDRAAIGPRFAAVIGFPP